MRRSFFSVARPTKNSSCTGSGQSFSSISQGKMDVTPSGFLSSPAILARILLEETPMLTVKPSSCLIRSASHRPASMGEP